MNVAALKPIPLRLVAGQPMRDVEEVPISILTRQMREGNDEGWREFHGRFYFDLLRLAAGRVASPDDAMDVMQQVYLRIARHIKEFQNEDEFRHWLACVVRCAAVDYQRGMRRRALLLEKFAHWQEAQKPADFLRKEAATQNSLALDALEQLPPEEANLLRLKYYESWSVEQIATQSGATPKAIENRLARARQRLREIILRTP